MPGAADMSDAREWVEKLFPLGVYCYIFDPVTPESIIERIDNPGSPGELMVSARGVSKAPTDIDESLKQAILVKTTEHKRTRLKELFMHTTRPQKTVMKKKTKEQAKPLAEKQERQCTRVQGEAPEETQSYLNKLRKRIFAKIHVSTIAKTQNGFSGKKPLIEDIKPADLSRILNLLVVKKATYAKKSHIPEVTITRGNSWQDIVVAIKIVIQILVIVCGTCLLIWTVGIVLDFIGVKVPVVERIIITIKNLFLPGMH